MTKKWFPQRFAKDALTAVLKSMMHYIEYPISRTTIEKEVTEHPDFPSFNFNSIVDLLQKWQIEAVPYKLEIDKLSNAPSTSITFITETYRKREMSMPVLFFSIENDVVTYIHPRKGWIYASKESFIENWCGALISIKSIPGNGESYFEANELNYERDKITQPESHIVEKLFDVLSKEECEYLMEISNNKFEKSTAGAESRINLGRTSFSAFLDFYTDEIAAIREKISALIEIDTDRFEHFQIVSYMDGQEYQAHYDTFDPYTEHGQIEIESKGQRQFTLLIYLNDDFVGGQTYFPKLDYLFSPKQGMALLFKNTDGSGNIYESAIHAGLPVSKGRKYALNLWIRE